jgi:hypothetical protein
MAIKSRNEARVIRHKRIRKKSLVQLKDQD